MISYWIYYDQQRKVWQMKCNDHGKITVVREFRTRGDAYRYCAWGVS